MPELGDRRTDVANNYNAVRRQKVPRVLTWDGATAV